MTECIEISGNTTEMVLDSIKKANDKIQADSNSLLIKEIRLFNVDLARLNIISEDAKMMFEGLLNSRQQQQYWERVVVCLCRGDLSPKAAQGILNTKRLEVYGNTLNLLHVYAKMQQQSSESSSPSSSSSTTTTTNNNKNIEIMKIRTRFDRTSIIPLSEIISSPSSSLKALNLTCEFTDRESMISMSNAFNQNTNLKHLTIYSCEFFDESTMENLILSLVNHPTLSTLALQDNNHLCMSAVTELLISKKTTTTRGCCLNSLILYHPPFRVNVNDGGEEVQIIPQVNVETLSIALKQNTSLKSLDLSSNGLNDGSAMCLALALRFNTTLKSLNLQGNKISDKGAMALGKALPEMNLRELYLWNNKFCGVGARALLAGLKHNMTLETITTFSSFLVSKELQYYTYLNRAGRAKNVLSDPNSLPMNVWPLVLDRVNSQQDWGDFYKCSVLYTLLREGPAAISS